MKVTHAKTRIVSAPPDNPLVEGIPVGGLARQFVTLELMTDDGVEGVGLSFFGGRLTGSLRSAIDSLCEVVIGEDPIQVEAIAAKLRQAAGATGPGGIVNLAISAIDIALWDIKGKAFKQSVSALLGGFRDRAPTYASGALLRQYPLDYLAKAGPRLVEKGFRQMKMQLGWEKTVDEAEERVRVMREGIGEDIDLMCDINQLWSVHQAIETGKRIEHLHLYWLEDVVAFDDYQGLARVTDALTTPITAGEYQWGIKPFRQMLAADSVDIVMIDLLRVGGITQWLKVAGMAEAFNMPVVSHLFPEIHVQLITAIPHGLTVEYYPVTYGLFEQTPAIEDGQIVVPDAPGLGLSFDKDFVSKYEVT